MEIMTKFLKIFSEKFAAISEKLSEMNIVKILRKFLNEIYRKLKINF